MFSSQILQGGAGEKAKLSVDRKKGASGLSKSAGPGKPSRKDLSQSHMSQKKCSSINLTHVEQLSSTKPNNYQLKARHVALMR